MSTRSDFFEEGAYLDPSKLLNAGSPYRMDDILDSVSFKDVEELLNFSDAPELMEIAKRHSFFDASTRSELSFDFEKTDQDNAVGVYSQLYSSCLGYICMRSHMEKAIELKDLLRKPKITVDNLHEVGIEMADPPESHLEQSKKMRQMINMAQSRFNLMSDPMLADGRELCDRLLLPFYTLRMAVGDKGTPFAKHLLNGMKSAMENDGAAFSLEWVEEGYTYDVICDHFPKSPSGYRAAVTKALDSLFRITLWDVTTLTREGAISQRANSVYSAYWYHLARGLEGGRAMRCKACRKPLIAFGERGKKRVYCSEACRKWHQRHPGETRAMRI